MRARHTGRSRASQHRLRRERALAGSPEGLQTKRQTEKVLAKVLKRLPTNIKKSHMTPFALAMGAEPDCIDHDDCIGSYQNFYQTKQKRFAMKWTKRNTPHWFKTL